MTKNCTMIALACVASALLAGCQTAPKPLYQWGNYQPVVYKHFLGTSPEEQVSLLEEDVEKIKSSGNAVPPGLYAHLGMLYFSMGKSDLGLQELLTEKKLFPESANYMDFLINKTQKKEQ